LNGIWIIGAIEMLRDCWRTAEADAGLCRYATAIDENDADCTLRFFRTITIGFAGGDAVRLVGQGRWRPGDGRWHEVNKFPHNEKFAMPARCAEKSLEFTSGS
jgi:hypothetical protein